MRLKFVILCLVIPLTFTFTGYSRTHAQSDEELHLTFSDLGYTDISLTNLDDTTSIWVPFQSNWVLNAPLTAEIVYTASPLLNRTRTTLTIQVSDVPIVSISPITDGAEHTLFLSIPWQQLHQDGISLRFLTHLPLSELDCPAMHDPSQWLRILSKSSVTIPHNLDRTPPDLKDLQKTIVVQNVLGIQGPPPILFVLPDSPSSDDLTAAARVAARLGSFIGKSHAPIRAATPSTLTKEDQYTSNIVIIGVPSNQPLIKELGKQLPAAPTLTGFTTSEGADVPPEQGVIQIFNSPWSDARKVLLVSGGNTSGLRLAGQVFANSATFETLQGPVAFIESLVTRSGSSVTTPAWSTEQTSFEQLGILDKTLNGLGAFQQNFYVRRPPGWILASGSQLVLHLAFSPALIRETSQMSVFINDIPVGITQIGGDVTDVKYTFDLPVAALNQTLTGERPQTMTIRVAVQHFIKSGTCEPTQSASAWTTILKDSFLVTPHGYMILPDLQAYPYPFVGDRTDATPVTIVLPPSSNSIEQAKALSLAATLGRFALAEFEMTLLMADQASPDNSGNSNLIILGATERQPLIAKFSDVMETVTDNRVAAALNNPRFGMLREGRSAWNSERVALLVSGITEEGFANAVDSLSAAPPVLRSGSIAVAEPNRPPRIIYASANQPILFDTSGAPQFTPPDASVTPANLTALPQSSSRPAPGAGRDTGGSISASPLVIAGALSVPIIIVIAILGLVRLRRQPVPPTRKTRTVADTEEHQPAHILIIEDDESIRRLILEYLVAAGYKTEVAQDGLAAIQMAEANKPDLIVMDIMMPNMDGYDTAKQFREIEQFANVPIIMLTALSDVNFKLRAFESGVDDYMTKPFDGDELVARIAAILRRSEDKV